MKGGKLHMKKLKVVILSALVMTGLAGCGDKGSDPVTPVDPEPEHTHTYSSEWSSDATQHWHAATCEHTDLKANVANHVDSNHDGKCDVCAHEGIEVKHTDSGNGYCSCGLKIKVESVVLNTENAKKVYALGEELEIEGVTLTATYSDGSTALINFVPSADLSSVGPKTVTLTYNTEDEEGTTATISYEVEVTYWSEEDLMLLNVPGLTYLSDAGITFPYMNGMKTRYTLDEDNYITDWAIVLEDASEEDELAYVEKLSEVGKVIEVSGYEVQYEFEILAALPSGAAEYFGVIPSTAFGALLIPKVEVQPGYTVRWEDYYDELVVGGIDENGDLVISNYNIDASFESYMGIPLELDNYFDELGLVAGFAEDVKAFFNSDIGGKDWFSNPNVNGVINFPLIASEAEEAAIFTTNFIPLYPFSEEVQAYDLAFEFWMQKGSDAERTAFINDLLAKGFKLDGEPQNVAKEGAEPFYYYNYVLDNKFNGRWEVSVSDLDADEDTVYGYYIDINFIAPEETYSVLRAYAELQLIPALNLEVDDVELTEEAGQISIVYVDETEDTAEQVLAADVNELTAKLGYDDVTIPVTEYPAESGIYVAELNNGFYEISASAVKEEGVVTTTLTVKGYVPHDITLLSIFKAMYANLFPEAGDPVEDEDYEVAEDGTIEFVFPCAPTEGKMDTATLGGFYKLFAGALPAYMSEFEKLAFYYTDSTRSDVFAAGSYRTADKLITVDIEVWNEDGVAVAYVTIHTTVPTGLTAELVASEIAYTLYGNPTAYSEVEEGVFGVNFAGFYYGLAEEDLTLGNLQYALNKYESALIPAYFEYAGYGTNEYGTALTYYYVSIDGAYTLEYTAAFSKDEVEEGQDQTYSIDLYFFVYATPAE